MRTLFFTFVIATTAILFSCNNEADITSVQYEDDKTRAIETVEYLNITYKGITYKNVPTTYDENGDFIFLDKDFAVVYQKELANNFNWSIAAKDSYNITFYPSLETNLESNGLEVLEETNSSRSARIKQTVRETTSVLAELTLYDDQYYKDRNISFEITESQKGYCIPNLKKSHKFNDKCSSLIIINNFPYDYSQPYQLNGFSYPCSEIEAVFVGYDDSNYSDRTITGIATANSVKKYATLPGFNDKLSSFKFFLAHKGEFHDNINS